MNPGARCPWCGDDPLYVKYHDEEWGVPVRDGRRLFEMLILEGAQAGLSWITVLRKRDRYREVFDGFDVRRIARYDDRRTAALLADPGIIRNRAKIAATIGNAKAVLALGGCDALSEMLWAVVDHRPVTNRLRSLAAAPAKTPQSDAMSRRLAALGFKFVGSTICYAFMQAVGMVNDHLVTCPRHAAVARMG